ncbi:MAG: beta-lactamase family protein [Planctomycetota bacterium]|nr:beta-lactamase family protein [Planctomycetota bacterium]
MLPRLNSILDGYVERDGLSFVMIVRRGGATIFERASGVADPETGAPLTLHSPFNLASVTKPFTALCIMQLRQRGALEYDDDIREWLPEVPCEGITVRHLLTHTSGLPEYFEPFRKRGPGNGILRNRGVLELICRERPERLFPPGDAFHYCNTNYILLALIAEAAAGKPLAEYIVPNVLVPAGMSDAFPFMYGQAERPGMVRGFEILPGGGYRLKGLGEMDGVFGDGNLYASAADLCSWSGALASGRLVAPALLEEAFRPFRLNGGEPSYYGLGWRIDRRLGFPWHAGSWMGCRNYIRYGRGDGFDVVLLSNSSFARQDELIKALNECLDSAGAAAGDPATGRGEEANGTLRRSGEDRGGA